MGFMYNSFSVRVVEILERLIYLLILALLMQWSGNPICLSLSYYYGSVRFELNPLPNYGGLYSKVVVWITLLSLRVDSTILSVDFHSKTKISLIWLLKEWISINSHLESEPVSVSLCCLFVCLFVLCVCFFVCFVLYRLCQKKHCPRRHRAGHHQSLDLLSGGVCQEATKRNHIKTLMSILPPSTDTSLVS